MRACLLLVGLLGCRPGTSTPSPSPSSSSSLIEPAPAIATPVGTAGCELELPAAVGAAAAEGPAFVLVDGVGVLRISDGAVRTVLALKDHVASSTVMVVGPGDGLWLSDYAGVRVLAPDGALRVVRGVKDGPRYDNLVVRSPSDVWAVSNDIEWEVVHYDGQRWKAVRRRTDFPGRYDDNKFNRMVVNGEGVWVASWNGVWRGSGGKWEAIVVPAEIEAHETALLRRATRSSMVAATTCRDEDEADHADHAGHAGRRGALRPRAGAAGGAPGGAGRGGG